MTVGDINQRMTNAELSAWIGYVEKNGPLNPMLRIESAIARATAPFLKNASPKDLMVWPREPERIASAEEMALMFKNLAARTNSRKH